MITAGDRAPDFELDDDTGTPRRLGTLLFQGPVVLFFYPGAMTNGCTAEACHFRDLAAEFSAVGAQRLGISGDAVDKQREFSEQNEFDFPLLSDPGGEVAARYGVRRRLGPVRRATFVIGTDGTVVTAITNELQMEAHADRALEALRP